MIPKTTKRSKPRPRRWACAHCHLKNLPGARKCERCRIGRTTKRTSLSARCDSMWAQIVKAGGKCEVVGRAIELDGTGVVVSCFGQLEAAHIVPRRHRSTRWLPENGRPLCHFHHAWFTVREKHWRDFIGPEWDRLWELAQVRWDKTFPIAELSAQLAEAKRRAA